MATSDPTADGPVRLSKTGPASAPWTPDPPGEPSIGELVQAASTHFSTLLRGEIELAKAEVTTSVKKGVQGAVFFGAAAVVLAYSLVFLLISLAEGLVALGLWRWLSYLLVWLLLVLIAAAAVFLGVRAVKKVKAPERTIETMKDNKELLQRGPTG